MTLNDYCDREHWSASSLNQLLSICGLAWKFCHIDKLPRRFTPVALVLGSAFHRVMEFIALHRMEGNLPAANETRDLFHTVWEKELLEGPPMEQSEDTPDKLAEQGAGLAEAYLNQIDPEERVVDINRAFAVPAGGRSSKPIIGEMDCIVESAGEITILDWKTSARRWPKGQADKALQPTVYLYAQEQLQPGIEHKFRFDVAVKNKTPVIERIPTSRTPDDFRRLEHLVETADRVVEQGLFWPCESWACDGCMYSEPCKAWHRQAARTTVNLAA